MKRSLAPGAAPGGTSTVCAAPLGMRHLDAVGVITREPLLGQALTGGGCAKKAARGQWL